ncbi:MAG TPA: efflux RND transporter periplasmic adaptor subunit [Balneolales bacterium]|nr:efflux RND transporter periplasmic adaptor subunit [Balneolales bacterium]HYX08407.1 efflux RND transporter periplasmic adaptor subunit [Bacteroidales bacterium]
MSKKKSSTRKLIIIFSVVIVLLIVFVIVGKKAGWIGSTEKVYEVETAKAKLKTITQVVSASGKIQPEVEVKLSPDVSGEIVDLPVKEGQYVKKGELLLRIKPDIYQASIDQLQANLLEQKARLQQNKAQMLKAKTSYLQQKQLYAKGVVSQMDYVSAKTTYESAQASYKASQYQVENAKAQLHKAKEQLQQTIINSPMNGTISKLEVEKGERVVGSVQMAGTELMRIAHMNQMEVDVKVNENDIVNVSKNDTAVINVDAYPNKTFKGIVTQIANSATVTGQGTTEQVTDYEVKIRVLSPHNQDYSETGKMIKKTGDHELNNQKKLADLKPGMSATVDIQTKTVHDAVAVPIQAVTVRDYSKLGNKKNKEKGKKSSGALAANAADVKDTSAVKDTTGNSGDLLIPKEDLRKVVFKVVDGKAKMVEVKTGISDETHMQINSGVNPGDQIVIGSYRILSKELSDGDPVKVNNKKFETLAKE